jgi:hypothetical protein
MYQTYQTCQLIQRLKCREWSIRKAIPAKQSHARMLSLANICIHAHNRIRLHIDCEDFLLGSYDSISVKSAPTHAIVGYPFKQCHS